MSPTSATGPETDFLSSLLDNPNVPTPPALALQIVDKASRPTCDLKEIAALIGQDPALCARVLKTVNSGMYGLARPLASVERAVMVMGARPLRSLVLGLSLTAMQTKVQDELVYRYWQESVGGAVIARELAVHLRKPAPDDYLVAGLLRDLGILVLRDAFGATYTEIWTRTADLSPTHLCDEERQVFGTDHAEISATLLRSWHLPDEIVIPVAHHHHPQNLTGARPADVERAYLLSFASDLTRANLDRADALASLLRIARERFGMDQSSLANFLARVMPKIREFAKILNVNLARCPNYAAIVAAGCEQLTMLTVENTRTPAAPQRDFHNPSAFDQTITNKARRNNPGESSHSGQAHRVTEADFDIASLLNLGEGGTQLNGYHIEKRIGRGAMGIVFKAFDPLLNRHAAIKMLTPESAVSREARERFLLEARAAAVIQHENVVTIYSVSQVRGTPYLVMEYLPGRSLQETLDRHGPLPIRDVIAYARQIAAGLNAAHSRRIIHRDIKPANILVREGTNIVKIADFGLARVQDELGLSLDGAWVGTPLFMSPEQFKGGNAVDHRSDLFSLGSLLYTLCAGRTPFEGDNVLAVMKHVCEVQPKPLRLLRPEVPQALENLIVKMHAKCPTARIASAARVIEELMRMSS